MSFVELLDGADSYTSLAEVAATAVSVDPPEATIMDPDLTSASIIPLTSVFTGC